jgi:tetratricopeptide (TPR) repeat protein
MEARDTALTLAEKAAGQGDPATALTHLKGHLQCHGEDARAWALAAHCLRRLGGLGEARAAAQRALAGDPQLAAAWRELGIIERMGGRTEDAAHALRRALSCAPGDPDALVELAMTLARSQPADALACLDDLSQRGQSPPGLLYAQLLLAAGQASRAVEAFERLLEGGKKGLAVVRGAYWSRVLSGDRSPRRRALADRLCALQPGAEAWLNRAQEDIEAGDFNAAHEAIEQASQRDPAHPGPAWAAFQIPAHPAPLTEAEQQAFCARWEAGVKAFAERVARGEFSASQLLDCAGYCSAFYRHYLGDALPGQAEFGALLTRIMADSGLAPAARRRSGGRGGRRVAVVSAHLREHTVARLFVPLFEQLSAEFDWLFFSLDPREDAWTQRVARLGPVQRGPGCLREWAMRIAATDADVILYPEVGMDARTLALAAMRLAPRQAALWGHPVSPGLASLDALLSPDALEPSDGEHHYAEALVRLPGLGHGMRPEDLPTAEDPGLDIAADEIPLLCAQTVYKLLPAQDVLFARILARLPSARLHLLVDPRAPVREFIAQRLGSALRAAGVDPERQLRLHGFLPLPRFLGLAQRMRLNLDTLGWSGGMSALDLLAQGLPTLTLSGATMRCRQTAALLERLALPELVARDPDDYVERAVALASDLARCAALSSQLLARRACLFDQGEVAPFLAAWLRGDSTAGG